jgi:hypothetical protein
MEAEGEKGKGELKFRCLKKEDKRNVAVWGIGVQTKAEKCFLMRKLDILAAHQHFGQGLEEFKTVHLTVGSSKILTWCLSTQLSPVKVIRPKVFMVVVEMIKNLVGLKREKDKTLTFFQTQPENERYFVILKQQTTIFAAMI